ncbi:MAG: DUF4160 domain-containing protein [Candidatus Marinimicrobia bacterium]|nr:DUF4160 domain-containing protein [Candidatus Neomarinimicrobiota bacterium]MBL7030436.1 DUF4160 domain-containing protein [Candidatus Neomarinimicrobiota bacterium]
MPTPGQPDPPAGGQVRSIVKYQGQEAVLSIPDGDLLEGELKTNKIKLVQAWIEIHKEDLM